MMMQFINVQSSSTLTYKYNQCCNC